jgi:hypothetical protein
MSFHRRQKQLGPVLLPVLNDLAKGTNTRMHLTIIGPGSNGDDDSLFVST